MPIKPPATSAGGVSPTAAEIYDILIEQLLRAIRKFDPEYNLKLKQIVEMIDDKFAGPKFTLAAVNRHLGFDAVGHLRLLVRR